MSGGGVDPSHPTLAVSVAVFRDGRVLLASRGKPPWEGLFSLPGGRVELGETLEEAALRELAEEVGVSAELTGLLTPFEVIERNAGGRVEHHTIIAVYAARWLAGEPRTGPEAKEVRWIRESGMEGLRMTPDLGDVLAKAFAHDRGLGSA